MRYLTLGEVVALHRGVIDAAGGAAGIRDVRALDSAVAQPKATFGSAELYPTAIEKAAALGFSLIRNHPFVDGNKRVGHAAMETFLVLNGSQIDAPVDEQEHLILDVAAGKVHRDQLTEWLHRHVKPLP